MNENSVLFIVNACTSPRTMPLLYEVEWLRRTKFAVDEKTGTEREFTGHTFTSDLFCSVAAIPADSGEWY